MSAVLSVRALAKSFGELEALRDVSFDVQAGETVAVVGPNGAGKTTLLRMIIGRETPERGKTTLLSIIAGLQPPSAGSVSRSAREVGWAPQQPALYSKLSVAENLELFARLEKLADPAGAVRRMLEQTGLAERADEPVGRLSGGNRQRVNVALGLIADPPVLALDEPSASLDPAQRERLWAFLAGLTAAGTAVVFSTHHVGEAQRHADRLLVLDDGRLLFDGSPAQLKGTSGVQAGDLEDALVRFLEQAAATAGAAT